MSNRPTVCFYKQFCENTATLISLYIIYGCFHATMNSRVVSMEILWPSMPLKENICTCFKVNICLTSTPGFWGWSLDIRGLQNFPMILICRAENVSYEYVSKSWTDLGFKRCSTTHYPGQVSHPYGGTFL